MFQRLLIAIAGLISIGYASRVQLLSKSIVSACVAGAVCFTPFVSLAAVGEGDLPAGAIAFSKLLKYQKEWDTLASSVQVRKSEMDQKEVLGIKFFLKQLANEYYDMDLLSNTIADKEKATAAKALAKEFRSLVRECDDAASDNNLDKLLENYPKTAKQITNFLDLLSDVPDEL